MITGCSGFLAHYLVDLLVNRKIHPLFGITEEGEFKSEEVTVFNVDIRDQEEIQGVVKKVKPDVVFHLAALSNVGLSWKNQKKTYEVNLIGSLNILDAVHRYCTGCRVVLMSSAELYGGIRSNRMGEGAGVSIKNPYALSKYAMEMLGDLYQQAMDLDVITIRSFNFTGPGQSENFVCSDFARQIAAIEKGDARPRIQVGNLDVVRDFSDVRDVARYLFVLAEKGCAGGLYNVCCGRGYSIKEILNRLISFSPVEIGVETDASKLRPTDTPYLVGDCTLIQRQFGCYPEYEIDQTLTDILNYWRGFYK